MFKSITALTFISLFSINCFAQSADKDFIRLVDNLDEPKFYCIDLSGRGDQLRLDDPVQTHSCKPADQAADQLAFRFEGDQIQVVGHERCLQATGSGPATIPGAPVLARACSNSPLQKLSLHEDGTIRLAETPYCLGIGAVSGTAGGGNQLWRTLNVMNCADADQKHLTWQIGM